MMQLLHVVIVTKTSCRCELIGSPSGYIRLSSGTLLSSQALRILLGERPCTVTLHKSGNCFQVIFRIIIAGFFRSLDGLLLFLRHIADTTLLLTFPDCIVGKCTGKHYGLNAFRCVVTTIDNGKHTAPGLSKKVYLVQVKVLTKGDQLIYPGFLRPKLRMSIYIGISATDLVIHDNLSVIPVC